MDDRIADLEAAVEEEGEALDEEIECHCDTAGKLVEARERIAILESALDDIWREAVAYRFPQVCKHLVASNILSRMETLGFEVPKKLAEAVVNADDETALAFRRLRILKMED